MTGLFLAAGGLAGLLALVWFVHLEASGRREVIAGVVLLAFVVETILYQSEHDVPTGLFRLPFAVGSGLHPPDVLLPLAILACFLVHGMPKRASAPALAWALFLAWYAAGAVLGYLRGNGTEELLFQAKAVLYVGGGFFVMSGVRPERLVRPRFLGGWAIVLGCVTAVLIATTLAETSVALAIPFAEVPELGELSVDARLLLPIIGLVALLVEVCRPHRRLAVIVASVVLVAAPFAGTQAAAYLSLGALLLAVALALLGPTSRKRVLATPTESLLVVGGVSALAIVAGLLLVSDPAAERVGVVDQVEDAFFTSSQARTSGARLDLWADGWDLLLEDPLLGQGLGQQLILRTDFQPDVQVNAHNIVVDVAVRTGLVGVALLLVAVAASLRQGVRVWRRHRDPLVAALAAATLVGLASLLANGMVVSSLDRFRHATLLGLLLGLLAATSTSLGARREPSVAEEADDVVPTRAR